MLLALCVHVGAEAQSGSHTDTPTGSSVKIERIEPSLAQLVRAGTKVRFEVEISYVVTADSATVGLIVQRGDSSENRVLSFTTDIAPKGSGKLTMSTEVVIPDTRVIHVFTPLSHQGDSRTSVVDMRSYKVVSKD
jgi:hypothetical protein